MSLVLLNSIYLIAAILFIIGLKGLTNPRTAVLGNFLSATGMLIAIVVTLLNKKIISYEMILIGLVVGTAIGAILAVKIQMTAMPQLVAIYNGFGGGASALVAGAALLEVLLFQNIPNSSFMVATVASCLIGSVTFSGSLVAFGKLQGLIRQKAIASDILKFLQVAFLIAVLGCGVWLTLDPAHPLAFWILLALSFVLGILLVIPIGGADMPVVIALLNSYSGLAAAATGFVIQNNILIIAGSLVGASGIVLTQLMCKAMNRSLTNVLFGGFGAVKESAEVMDDLYEGRVKSTSPDEVAMLLDTVRRVVIVPGYGLAVSQAQHAVRELADVLTSRGVEVEYAIHPVAGRMPGHMNVLLAEANVPYDQLKEMDEINPSFPQTDMAIVIGANDVVNPSARESQDSPIAGMPILNVDKARIVVVIKRSLSPGFAGVANPLFANENTLMLFGDGKKMVMDVLASLTELS